MGPALPLSRLCGPGRSAVRAIALTFAGIGLAQAQPAGPEARIVTDDVARFYALYDRHGPEIAPEILQRDYLDQASPGLAEFARIRRITADRIAESLRERPELYAEARQCADRLPAVRARLDEAVRRLRELLPEANLPPITIAVGRGRPVAVGSPVLVAVGLEALCAWRTPNPDPEDRFVHVIAHEYAHAQQGPEEEGIDVLTAALIEGGAELVAELISGSIAYQHLARYAEGREAEIETAFLADIAAPASGSAWVYNGEGTPERPGDLGYWAGYRIAKAYYLQAADKGAALRTLLALEDPRAILEESGWRPGMQLADEADEPDRPGR